MKRFLHRAAACAATAAACAGLAQAPAFPTRTVTIVVPYAAGGLPDTVARVVGQKLSEKWGQPVVIENKPGGNGAVSAQYLSSKAPDGYTLQVTDGTMFSVNPWIYKSLSYDPIKDFTFISLTARAPLFLAVQPSFPANDFPGFVKEVKAHPGKYTYGSSGIGSIHHLTTEMMKHDLGLDLLHVPFKGTGQSVPAVVGGQVSAVFSAIPSLAGFVKNGSLKLLAVNTLQRSQLAPEVQTVAENGAPGFDFAPNIGFTGPAGIPPALAEKISRDVADVVHDPGMKEKLRTLGIDAVGGSPKEYADLIVNDKARFEQAVKIAGAKAD
ncbi:MAG TPA: tripartite tricarboxylate transporter substrate binding protein [Usitatibacter sp.]|jgi:tripartite-type tricarboxylate transporter receptor subunit TctC|nr:tripartite tricarboxylate transporter substrate binding protein [Usitatibacter sp.]